MSSPTPCDSNAAGADGGFKMYLNITTTIATRVEVVSTVDLEKFP